MPTNVSTSFFFINLLFQARRAGSNPRPSCIPRCVAAQDKSRPGRRAYGSCSSRELRTSAAQCLGSQFAVRGRTGQVAPMAAGYGPRSSRGLCTCAAQCLGSQFAPRGPGPQWGPFRTDRAGRRDARYRSCSSKDIAHVRGVWLVGDWKSLAIGEFGRAQCIWVGQNPRAGWGQGAVLGFPFQAGRGGNRSGPNCFLVSFAQKLDAKNTGIPVKQRERHFAVILVG